MTILQAMMRLKSWVSVLAVICGMVSRLMLNTMPTIRSVATMVIAMRAIMRYSIKSTGKRCERAKLASNATLRMVR